MPASPSASDMPLPASGRFARGAHYFPVRVYFEDTDAGGIVYHANYLRFMERARSDMLRLVGIDQRAAQESGEGVYAVTHVDIDYRAPARLDDDLLVVSRVGEVSGATVRIAQDVTRGDDVLSCGEVVAAFLSPSGRPRRQPRHWITLFNQIAEGEDTRS